MSKYTNNKETKHNDAKSLEHISFKFEVSLYHKLYKEDILKILTSNSDLIKRHTKI